MNTSYDLAEFDVDQSQRKLCPYARLVLTKRLSSSEVHSDCIDRIIIAGGNEVISVQLFAKATVSAHPRDYGRHYLPEHRPRMPDGRQTPR